MRKKIKKAIKTVKNTIFADPELLFEEERTFVNEAFYFPGTNGKAVLLVHGWTSTAYEVRRLGKYLNKNGYTVYGPMLKGHGTVPKDLENITWNEWLEDAKNAYEKLKNSHQKVYIAGTSIGASLAMIMAQRKPEIAGLVLMATPHKLKLERLTMFFLKALMFLGVKYNRKYYPPTFGVSTTITRLISYQTYPLKSALETFGLVSVARKKIREIKQPCFMIQSLSDHIVARRSLDKIYDQIGSEIKKKKYIKRAYHTFISDIKNESVFEEILQFIKSN